ncbi:MAG: hypothetical protein ABW065_01160 [Solirubrobacterales bacterium]
MIRNLKVLFGAMLALVAFGVVSVSGAQAAEFHCSVENCRYRLKTDINEAVGAKNYHHVFIIDDLTTGGSVSFTCQDLTGEGTTIFKTASELTVTNLNYNDKNAAGVGCTIGGSGSLTVDMNGCDYLFSAAGTVKVVCPEGKKIELTKVGCTYTIGPQGPLAGITYKTIGTSPPGREVTVSPNVKGISITLDGTPEGCGVGALTDKFEGTYTTGNTTVTAETQAEVRADGWWE